MRAMIITWQTSTPALNIKIEVKNLLGGNPISFNELAKPNPCTNPNKKTNNMRQGFSSLSMIFSIATKTMDKAMMGSTISDGATMIFFMLNASATVWASVNAEAW